MLPNELAGVLLRQVRFPRGGKMVLHNVRTFFFSLPLVALFAATANAGTTVSITVERIPSDTGVVRLMLCTRAGYKGEAPCAQATLKPQAGTAHHEFEAVEPGTYIVQAFHDENGNGKLDFKLYGAPKEAVGTSNNPPPRWRRPTFEEGAFAVADQPVEIVIRLRGGAR